MSARGATGQRSAAAGQRSAAAAKLPSFSRPVFVDIEHWQRKLRGCTAKSSKSRRSNPYAAGGKACCPGSCRTQVQFVALLSICKVCLRTSLVVELRASATANEYMFNLGMASGLKQHVHCRVVIGDIELMVSTTTLRFRRYLLRNPATPVIHAIT